MKTFVVALDPVVTLRYSWCVVWAEERPPHHDRLLWTVTARWPLRPTVDPDVWMEEFDSAFARIAGRFTRAEPRLAARAWLLGLLCDVDTRSCWQMAEQAGHP